MLFPVFIIFQNMDTAIVSAQTYYISPKKTNGERDFSSLADFMTKVRSGAICLRGGDKILFERGYTYRGSLNVVGCADASGVIEVGAFGNPAPSTAYILASVRPSDQGLSWTLASAPTVGGKTVSHLAGARLFRMGPFEKKVKQVWKRPILLKFFLWWSERLS